MATEAIINVPNSGSSPVAMFSTTWTIGTTPTTVFVQASAIADVDTGTRAPVDANGLHVVPSYGSPNASGPITATVAGGGGGTATLTSPVLVTSGKVAALQHAIFGATAPCSWTLQTVDATGSSTNRATFVTPAFGSFQFEKQMLNEITTAAGDGTHVTFQVACSNLDTNALNPATAYANFFWAEN